VIENSYDLEWFSLPLFYHLKSDHPKGARVCFVFKKSTKLISFVVLASVLLVVRSACAEEQIQRALVSTFFGGAALKECSTVKSMSARECEKKQYFIRYMTTKLLYVYQGFQGEIGGMAGFETVPPELSDKLKNKTIKISAVERFSRYESPVFQACLRKSCGELIDAPTETLLNLPGRWYELSTVFSCIAQSGPGVGTFQEAQRGVYGGCFSERISNEVLDIGIALSPPDGKF
jgi:hypothetical protein